MHEERKRAISSFYMLIWLPHYHNWKRCRGKWPSEWSPLLVWKIGQEGEKKNFIMRAKRWPKSSPSNQQLLIHSKGLHLISQTLRSFADHLPLPPKKRLKPGQDLTHGIILRSSTEAPQGRLCPAGCAEPERRGREVHSYVVLSPRVIGDKSACYHTHPKESWN